MRRIVTRCWGVMVAGTKPRTGVRRLSELAVDCVMSYPGSPFLLVVTQTE